MQLFHDVCYHLSPSIPQNRQLDIAHVLDTNGATQASSIQHATHVITNSNRFEGWQDLDESVYIVTDTWVDRSMILGKLQPPAYYSAEPAMIFSGVVACAAELPAPDLEVLSAGITALGGQWRTGLTKDVTHLFAITNTSLKYTTAMHFQEHTHVKVLLPHWFDDAVRLGMRNLSVKSYEWPDPPLLKGPGESSIDDASAKLRKLDAEKQSLFKTALWTSDSDIPNLVVKDVWEGRRILLSPSLELAGGRREAVEVGIKRARGVVVDTGDEYDILVTRYRSGKAYVDAVRQGKTIGTLSWVFHVQSTGVVSRPLDQLLHYPFAKRPIDGFSGHEITVTNYTGESREYLKKLITAMGATFTPSMSGRNTVLIAAYISGTKTTKAASWSIPIVNHTWLEDCFIKWRNLTVGLEKYIVFPPGIDFSTVLGERGVGRGVEEVGEEELEALEREEEDGGEGQEVEILPPRAPLETQNSARDAMEVERFMGELAFGGDTDAMDVDEEPGPPLASVSVGPKAVTLSKSTGALKGKAVKSKVNEGRQGSDDGEVEVVTPSKKPKSGAAAKSTTSKATERDVVMDADEPRSAKPRSIAKEPRSMAQASSRTGTKTATKKGSVSDHDEDEGPSSRAQEGSGQANESKKRGGVTSEEEEVVPAVKPSRKLVRRAGQSYESGFTLDEDVDMEEENRRKEREAKEKQAAAKRAEGEKARQRKLEEKRGMQEEEEEPPERSTRKSTMMSAVKSGKAGAKGKGKVVSSEEEQESETEAILKAKSKKEMATTTLRGKMKGKAKPVDNEEPEVKVMKPTRGRASVGKTKGKSKPVDSDHEEESEVETMESTKRKDSVGKTKAKAKRVDTEPEEDESDEEVVAAKSTKGKGSVGKVKAKTKHVNTDPEEDESEEEVVVKKLPPKKARSSKVQIRPEESEASAPLPKAKTKSQATIGETPSVASPVRSPKTPKRVLSVMMPPHKTTLVKGSVSESSLRQSTRAAAGEDRVHGSANKPSAASGSRPKHVEASSPLSTIQPDSIRSSVKRGAATKASQKLRDEIMPDLMSYQQEMRNARSRRGPGPGEYLVPVASGSAIPAGRKKRAEEAEGEDEVRDKKRRRISAGKGKATDDDGDDPIPSTKSKKKGKARVTDDEETDDEPATKASKKTKENIGNVNSSTQKGSKTIKLLTTQVTLSDDVVKALSKLGVRMTTRAAECTHLLAPHLVRTEKFLCALAVAPFILSEKWAIDSAAAKRILPEDKYLLHDKNGERKYNCDLADALRRAKELDGKLFAKKTFYVTPKVPIDSKLLKNVVTACGGQVTTQVPSVRILNASPDRHIISCPEDISIWRSIAQHHPVFTQELLLTGALKQQVEWDNPAFRVTGSS